MGWVACNELEPDETAKAESKTQEMNSDTKIEVILKKIYPMWYL